MRVKNSDRSVCSRRVRSKSTPNNYETFSRVKRSVEVKNAKIKVGRLETRTLAGVLEVFEMGFYRLQNVFERKNVGRNRLGGSSKVEDCRSKTRTVNPGSWSAIEVFESVLNMLLLCKYEGKNNKANGQNWLSGDKNSKYNYGQCRKWSETAQNRCLLVGKHFRGDSRCMSVKNRD